MIRNLLECSDRLRSLRSSTLAAAWRALDDDPLLLCGCEASAPGPGAGSTCCC